MNTARQEKSGPNRRALLVSAAVLGAGLIADPMHAAQAGVTHNVRNVASAAHDVTIKSIETFDIQVPQRSGGEAGLAVFNGATPGRINVTRIETNSGTRGYSFLGSTPDGVVAARKTLIGQSLFAVEVYLTQGLLDWPGVEEAMWDAIGKIAGQPVSMLLGGTLTSVPVYITYVWPGAKEQWTPKQQAQQAPLVKQAGFNAMKIQIQRNDYNLDVEACSEILAVGGDGFRVMVDRTAAAIRLWTYDEGLAAAKALKAAGVYWLEEPFARTDYESPGRLARETGIIVTGGEAYRGLDSFRECLKQNTYSILQPELRVVSGVLMVRKVGVLCQAWGLKLAPHASAGLMLAGRLQASAASGAHYQEIGVLNPPWLPEDMSAPFLPILHGIQPFTFKNGEAQIPPHPGLGLNIDETAVNKFRVEGFEFRPPPAAQHLPT